ILTPEHTKRLMLTLQENIERYESIVGRIDINMPEPPTITGFGTIES
ncbi:MAG: DUF3467 domain-containing protein, partial [Mucinivorans sp.]